MKGKGIVSEGGRSSGLVYVIKESLAEYQKKYVRKLLPIEDMTSSF